MATAGNRDSKHFWSSVGMGLIAGLLIVGVIFRLTAPHDVIATTETQDSSAASDDTTETVITTAPTSTPLVPTSEPAVSTPIVTGGDTSASSGEATTPTIKITRTLGSCKFGPKCLGADFTISGFASQPTKFVCEFQDGTQWSYNFEGNEVKNACFTTTVPGSITILVDGVRSETVTNP